MNELLRHIDYGKVHAANLLVCAALYLKEYDKSVYTYSLLQGRMVDSVGVMAQCALAEAVASLSPEFQVKHRTAWAISLTFSANVLYETMQLYQLLPGTYDPGDFIAYGVGALGWAALHRGARCLYDSGLTDPINRALGVARRYEV